MALLYIIHDKFQTEIWIWKPPVKNYVLGIALWTKMGALLNNDKASGGEQCHISWEQNLSDFYGFEPQKALHPFL